MEMKLSCDDEAVCTKNESPNSCTTTQRANQKAATSLMAPGTNVAGVVGTGECSGPLRQQQQEKVFVSTSKEDDNKAPCSNDVSIPEWKGYQGELQWKGDGINNRGAVYGLILEQSYLGGPMSRSKISGKKWLENPSYIPRMQRSNLTFKGLINGGSYGHVWSASLQDDQNVAVKQFLEGKCDMNSLLEVTMKERDILIYLKSVRKSRVVNIVGAFFETDPFLVMELCLCDLREVMGKTATMHLLRYVVQILEGLQYIHSKGIWHLDVRVENVLITTANNAVLADFGNAIVTKDPTVTKMKTHHTVGCLWYNDWDGNHKLCYSAKSDVWAAACTFYQMERGTSLMKRGKTTRDRKEYATIARFGHMIDNRRQSLQTICEESKFASLLRLMLAPLWEDRLDAADLRNSDQLQDLCYRYCVNLDDCDDERSSIRPLAPINVQKFAFRAEEGTAHMYGAAFAAIYYDELEHHGYPANTQIPMYRPVASMSCAEMANRIITSGNLERFVAGVRTNDPLMMSLFTYIVDTTVGDVKGRQVNQEMQTDLLQDFVEAPAPTAVAAAAANAEKQIQSSGNVPVAAGNVISRHELSDGTNGNDYKNVDGDLDNRDQQITCTEDNESKEYSENIPRGTENKIYQAMTECDAPKNCSATSEDIETLFSSRNTGFASLPSPKFVLPVNKKSEKEGHAKKKEPRVLSPRLRYDGCKAAVGTSRPTVATSINKLPNDNLRSKIQVPTSLISASSTNSVLTVLDYINEKAGSSKTHQIEEKSGLCPRNTNFKHAARCNNNIAFPACPSIMAASFSKGSTQREETMLRSTKSISNDSSKMVKIEGSCVGSLHFKDFAVGKKDADEEPPIKKTKNTLRLLETKPALWHCPATKCSFSGSHKEARAHTKICMQAVKEFSEQEYCNYDKASSNTDSE